MTDANTELSELYAAMSTLRAVRRLREDPIPDDVLQRILQAAAWAPSGGNVQPWRIPDRAISLMNSGDCHLTTWPGLRNPPLKYLSPRARRKESRGAQGTVNRREQANVVQGEPHG